MHFSIHWHTNDVTVTFQAMDGLSGLASLTSPVVLTNEVIDELVEGIAVDEAGNAVTNLVVIHLDKSPPTLSGSPADGDVINSLRPPFVIEYEDAHSDIDLSTFDVVLDGTNVTALFQTFESGALWMPTNDLAVGEHTWQMSVSDQVGNAIVAGATFTIATNGPSISALNIADGIIVPDDSEIWVQGLWEGSNVTMSASVNFGEPLAVYMRHNQFGRLLPLNAETNVIALTAVDAAGVVSTKALRVMRSDRYRGRITSPSFGEYAHGQPVVVSGYVSPLIDEGLPTETNIVSVTVNGVATTLTGPNAEGNLEFTTVTPVPTYTNGGFTSIDGTITTGSGQTVSLSKWYVEGYRLKRKWTRSNSYIAQFAHFSSPTSCGNDWFVGASTAQQTETTITVPDPFQSPLAREEIHSILLEPEGAPTNTICVAAGSPDFGDITWALCERCVEEPEQTETNLVNSSTLALGLGIGTNKTITLEYFTEDPETAIRTVVGLLDEGEVEFYAPAHYTSDTTVEFTLTGVTNNLTVDGGNLSNLVFQIEGATMLQSTPIRVGEDSVTYLVQFPQTGSNAVYRINDDSFEWGTSTSSSTNVYESTTIVTTSSDHWLTFSGFHNEATQLNIQVTLVYPKTGPATDGYVVKVQARALELFKKVGINASFRRRKVLDTYEDGNIQMKDMDVDLLNWSDAEDALGYLRTALSVPVDGGHCPVIIPRTFFAPKAGKTFDSKGSVVVYDQDSSYVARAVVHEVVTHWMAHYDHDTDSKWEKGLTRGGSFGRGPLTAADEYITPEVAAWIRDNGGVPHPEFIKNP